MNSLSEIESTLRAVLSSDAMFGLVNTRVTLKTGVDLNGINPDDDQNAEKVGKVIDALQALGYTPSALRFLAKRKVTR